MMTAIPMAKAIPMASTMTVRRPRGAQQSGRRLADQTSAPPLRYPVQVRATFVRLPRRMDGAHQ